MYSLAIQLAIICPLVFIAAFVDSIAGGGGIISLPAYLFAGVPPHLAAGTNKFAMGVGLAVSSGNYISAGRANLRIAFYSIVGALLGSAGGSRLALLLDEGLFKGIILTVLPIAGVIILTQKSFSRDAPTKTVAPGRAFDFISFLIGLVMGVYDGLVGPGTGTFMIIAFVSLLGLDLVTASGCAKVSNLASTAASAVVYLISGKVIFMIGIPAMLCAMAGNYAGSRLAIKGGAKYIRPVMAVVIALLFIRFAADIITELAPQYF